MSGLTLITGSSNSSNDPSALTIAPQRLRDNVGKLKVSESQNLFEADFEYSAQPMRWEQYIVGGATISQVSALGGIQMSVTSASGDIAIRQTRPYIRYQPGKTMYMSSGFVFGTPYANQRQRVGFFDDGNGLFWEQGDPTATNPSGMGVVYRSDTSGVIVDTRTSYENWSDPYNIKSTVNWNTIQMIWIEYAWYGAGLLRWGVMIGGEPYTLHQVGIGNLASQTNAWSRTGNIPVRYELRNVGASTAGSMYHYGVSVLAEGKIDNQRGFTYGYGMAAATPARNVGVSAVRYPLLSIRYRTMGTLEYGVDTAYSGANGSLPANGAAITSVTQAAASTTINASSATWTTNQWRGKYVFCRGSNTAASAATGFAGAVIATSSISGTTLTVGTVTSGTVAVGQTVTGVGVATGTVITANISGSGAGSTWTVNTSQTAASTTMTLGAGALISTSATNYMTVGRYITISGAATNTTLNGTFPVTAIISATQFAISGASITAGSATGSPVYTQGQGGIGRITANTATSLTVVDNITGNTPMVIPPAASGNYIIGEIDRGQVLPQTLNIYSSANCTLELITSTYSSPISLTSASFATMYSLGSVNSFVERDVSATALTGGEVVYNTPLPAGGLQNFDLTNFFPLYTTVQGNMPDILTVAISTPSSGTFNVGASLVGQEAMS